MEINGKFYYLYGRHYNFENSDVSVKNPKENLVVYADVHGETDRVISSLEGLFISAKRIGINFLVCPEDKEIFEQKHKGKFCPF